jgi:hypothetical protein
MLGVLMTRCGMILRRVTDVAKYGFFLGSNLITHSS